PAEMLERAFLEPLLGVYDVAGIEQEVALREDGKPVLIARGRATELIPLRGTTYRIKGVSGVTIEFLRPEGDARGKADRIAVQADERAIFP
ncbi:hypothetical protein, partial [Halomonas marinisediminis]|uniref:hypothetical protein n=1 Tax=Halomonas marinisediminis TaxID=2546095 RepID=UPI0014048E27